MMQHPHHAKVTPKFCKQYGQVGDVINKALSEYKEEVTNGSFPGPAHSPYKISAADVDGFLNELQKLGLDKAASVAATAAEKIENAESPDPGHLMSTVTDMVSEALQPKMLGVVSVLPNNRRTLHTTHSWDFMGLLGEETMEIPGNLA
ncbi:unnamed protein product [Camellia sinensis]